MPKVVDHEGYVKMALAAATDGRIVLVETTPHQHDTMIPMFKEKLTQAEADYEIIPLTKRDYPQPGTKIRFAESVIFVAVQSENPPVISLTGRTQAHWDRQKQDEPKEE